MYTTPNQETTPQDSFIIFEDSGIQLRMTPDGYVTFVYAEPVRVAPFEVSSEIDLGEDTFDPTLRGFLSQGVIGWTQVDLGRIPRHLCDHRGYA